MEIPGKSRENERPYTYISSSLRSFRNAHLPTNSQVDGKIVPRFSVALSLFNISKVFAKNLTIICEQFYYIRLCNVYAIFSRKTFAKLFTLVNSFRKTNKKLKMLENSLVGQSLFLQQRRYALICPDKGGAYLSMPDGCSMYFSDYPRPRFPRHKEDPQVKVCPISRPRCRLLVILNVSTGLE